MNILVKWVATRLYKVMPYSLDPELAAEVVRELVKEHRAENV